jgi:hypothetical protein
MAAVAATLALLAIGCASCGGIRSYPSTASGSAQQSPPQASVTPTGAYRTYVSADWLYSFEYPAGWYDLPNSGAPNTQKYFSNQPNGTPNQLDANGIFVSIGIVVESTRPCANGGGVASDVSQIPISIDGESTTQYSSGKGVVAYALHAGWCYTFSFFIAGVQDRDLHSTEIAHLFSTFRFNR